MKKNKVLMAGLVGFVFGLALFAGNVENTMAATSSPAQVGTVNDSIGRMWVVVPSMSNHGEIWFYQAPSGFRGYIQMNYGMNINRTGGFAYHYEGYIYSPNVKSIPAPAKRKVEE